MLDLPDDRRAVVRRMLYDVGNSGRENRGEAEVSGANTEQACWDTLMHHLSASNSDLGWEALAALSEWAKCNVLLFVQCNQTVMYTANSQHAIAKWAEARAAGRAEAEAARMNKTKPGGRWADTQLTTTHMLVPRRMKDNWPFRVIYHRSQIVHTNTVNRAGAQASSTSGGFGHYESIVAHTPRRPDCEMHELSPDWEGLFYPNTPLHDHLRHIGAKLMAAQYNDLARVRMEKDYNSQIEVARYTRLSAAGLRRASLDQNKRGGYTGMDILPCIVLSSNIRVPADSSSSSSQSQSPRRQYETFKLLSEHGLLEGSYRTEQLVRISLDNFPGLVSLYDSFSAEQLLMPSAPGHVPIPESDYSLISAKEAFRKEDCKKKPAAVDNSRRREAEPRIASVAADTSIANAQVDRRRAPSLFTVTSTPTVPPTTSSTAPTIDYILKHSKDGMRFKVKWGAPTNDDQWVTKQYLWTRAEYRPMLVQYAERVNLDL